MKEIQTNEQIYWQLVQIKHDLTDWDDEKSIDEYLNYKEEIREIVGKEQLTVNQFCAEIGKILKEEKEA